MNINKDRDTNFTTEIWHKSNPLDVFESKILIDVDDLKKPNRCPICGERDYGREVYDPPV